MARRSATTARGGRLRRRRPHALVQPRSCCSREAAAPQEPRAPSRSLVSHTLRLVDATSTMEPRCGEVDALLWVVTDWGSRRPDVAAVALVGSWARGTATLGSDVDVVLLTDTPDRYLNRADWIVDLGAESVVRSARWGVIVERRLRMPSGLELDVGVGRPIRGHVGWRRKAYARCMTRGGSLRSSRNTRAQPSHPADGAR